jgi:Trk K+ transport system NAD-binding subunit
MRQPLLVLICAYAISVLGFVLVPGKTPEGEPWHMDFMHAFYFVSYMATTIGFGEIPYAFGPPQRMWAVLTIYLTVVSWFYAIGSILALIQNPMLKRAVKENRFARSVRAVREPFYLVCGYGDTGSLLIRAMTSRDMRAAVIDIDPERIDDLSLANLPLFVPALCGDAGDTDVLIAGGLLSHYCEGVVALTNDDGVNLKVAIATKLLNPKLRVICRAETQDAELNMESFGTDHVINPFDSFAERLAMALHSPGVHLIHDWLTEIPGTKLSSLLEPRRGMWVLCGFGRFGKSVYRYLQYEGMRVNVIEADPASTDPPEGAVVGRGTEAVTLREAEISQAAGIVAGTDNDTNNLSIIVTARDLNPDLFTVARQNRRADASLFRAAQVDLIMERSDIIAHKILAYIKAPLLADFLRIVRHKNNAWANELASRLIAVVGEVVPDIWTISISADTAPGVLAAEGGAPGATLGDLYRDHRARNERLPCLALMLHRGGRDTELPADDTQLEVGDRILFCGREGVRRAMRWVVFDRNVLRYVQTGEDRPDGLVWRWLAERRDSAPERG